MTTNNIPLVNIVVKTINRVPTGGVNYLGKTIDNLARGGVFKSPHLHKFIIVDSGSEDVERFIKEEFYSRCQLIDSNINHRFMEYGDNHTLHQCASRAIKLSSEDLEVTWSMVIEDDIDVCSNFLESVVAWLSKYASDSHRMYALGANYSQIAHSYARGQEFWKYPVSAFYGAQALVWSRSDADQLSSWLGDDPHYDGVRNHGHDLLLQRWGQSLDISHFLATVPCFVQHIGERSGIGNKFFTFPFAGREWSYV